MKVLEILQRAEVCCAHLPARTVSAKTLQAYRREFARMWREPSLDAWRLGIALDTYYHRRASSRVVARRRASLHVASAAMLRHLAANCFAAAERKDIAATKLWARVLRRALERIEVAVKRDPPLAPGAAALQSPASRWREAVGPHPERGVHSKKTCLHCCR